MPSWYKSTLSQLLMLLVSWLIIMIIFTWLIAIFAPEAYKAISEDKTLVVILVWTYLFMVQGVWNAYIGARNPNTPEVEKSETSSEVPVKDLHAINDIQDVW